MAEGDFIRGYLRRATSVLTGKKVIDKEYAATELSQHYGADEQMAADIVAHVMRRRAAAGLAVDALEAGILALAMDEARTNAKRRRPAPDLGPLRRSALPPRRPEERQG